MLVRDSKNPDGPRLAFGRSAWEAFAASLLAGGAASGDAGARGAGVLERGRGRGSGGRYSSWRWARTRRRRRATMATSAAVRPAAGMARPT